MGTHQYKCGGTLGDTYIHLCILYKLALTDEIHIYHRTKHKYWHDHIRDIYSLLPNIEVEFTDAIDSIRCPSVYSTFHDQKEKKFLEPFPDFHYPDHHITLPHKYSIIVPTSGKPNERARNIDKGRVMKHIKCFVKYRVVFGFAWWHYQSF